MFKRYLFVLMLLVAQTALFFGYCEELSSASIWYGIDMNNEGWILEEPPSFSPVTFRLQGDTVIADTLYQILRQDGGLYRGAVRKSADGAQVYYRPGNTEYLLYDFNVQVGDTVYAYDGFWSTDCEENPSPDFQITPAWEVLSVTTIDGRKHIKVKAEMTNEVEWIEGIGTGNMLFSRSMPCHTGYHSYWTLCAADSEDNILYSFNMSYLGITADCKSWESTDNICITTNATKILHNGQILILRANKIYTLQGEEVKQQK